MTLYMQREPSKLHSQLFFLLKILRRHLTNLSRQVLILISTAVAPQAAQITNLHHDAQLQISFKTKAWLT